MRSLPLRPPPPSPPHTPAIREVSPYREGDLLLTQFLEGDLSEEGASACEAFSIAPGPLEDSRRERQEGGAACEALFIPPDLLTKHSYCMHACMRMQAHPSSFCRPLPSLTPPRRPPPPLTSRGSVSPLSCTMTGAFMLQGRAYRGREDRNDARKWKIRRLQTGLLQWSRRRGQRRCSHVCMRNHLPFIALHTHLICTPT